MSIWRCWRQAVGVWRCRRQAGCNLEVHQANLEVQEASSGYLVVLEASTGCLEVRSVYLEVHEADLEV